MVEAGIRIALGGVLAFAAASKLVRPRSSRAALATFGIRAPGAQAVAWALLIAAELGLAAGVIAGSAAAAYAAAALLALFALGLAAALARGRGGAPCACFGSRSTVSGWSAGRSAALAAGFAALPALPQRQLETEEWLAIGIIVALLACAGLAVAVLALAREVGMLRLRIGDTGALELPGEGPEIGGRSSVVERFEAGKGVAMALAVFTSEGCSMCRTLEPAIASVASEDVLAVRTFDEVADTEIWRDLDVPGSPFAVALDLDGTVLAKGTFNSLAQLESVLATAERRRAGAGTGMRGLESEGAAYV